MDTAASLYTTFHDSMNRPEGSQRPPESANLFSSIDIPADFGMSEDGDGSDKRSTSIQEKNRRAQKRFRERQKAKMKDMTSQLDEIDEELNRLKEENATLLNRNEILEKVLSLRDDHIRMLQDEQQLFDLGKQYHTAAALLQDTSDERKADAMEETQQDAGPLQIVPPSAVKTMSGSELLSYWKKLVRELGNLLVLYDSIPSSKRAEREEVLKKICVALDKGGQLCMHSAILHPTNMQYLVASTLDGGRSGISAEDKSFWASVTESLMLQEDQEAHILALRDIFAARIKRIMESRHRILSQLRSVAVPERLIALQSVICETLKVNEGTQLLKANLQEEHLCSVEFIGTVFKTILSPLQKARAIVQSYPFYPDVYQIATAVANTQEKKHRLEGEYSEDATNLPAAKMLKGN